jgi:hypothetical protein
LFIKPCRVLSARLSYFSCFLAVNVERTCVYRVDFPNVLLQVDILYNLPAFIPVPLTYSASNTIQFKVKGKGYNSYSTASRLALGPT